MLALALAATLAAAPASRIAVAPVSVGVGLEVANAAALTAALVAEVRRRSDADVVSQRDVEAVLSLEEQKARVGCTEVGCLAELAGALGAARLVVCDLSRLGESTLVHLRLVETRSARVSAQADRRLRRAGLDDVLDVLPDMVGQLFGAEGRPAPPIAGPAALPTGPGQALAPPAFEVEELVTIAPEVRERLRAWTDGQGHYVVAVPWSRDTPVFAGDAARLWRWGTGYGSLNPGVSWELAFWDPRVPPTETDPHFTARVDGARLACGARITAYQPVPEDQGRALVAGATLLERRWRRLPRALARDDEGNYFLVEGERGRDGKETRKDPRIWVGPKGAMVQLEVKELEQDPASLRVVTPTGRLSAALPPRTFGVEQRWSVEWVTPAGARRPLTWLDLYRSRALIFRELSPYAGRALGTPCDPHFQR